LTRIKKPPVRHRTIRVHSRDSRVRIPGAYSHDQRGRAAARPRDGARGRTRGVAAGIAGILRSVGIFFGLERGGYRSRDCGIPMKSIKKGALWILLAGLLATLAAVGAQQSPAPPAQTSTGTPGNASQGSPQNSPQAPAPGTPPQAGREGAIIRAENKELKRINANLVSLNLELQTERQRLAASAARKSPRSLRD